MPRHPANAGPRSFVGWAMAFLFPNGGNGIFVELGLNPREEALKTIFVYTALWTALGFSIGCTIDPHLRK
jgi:hypothetical protein